MQRDRRLPQAAQRLQGAGVDAVIIDLRGNGGGLLEEAITLSGPVHQHRARSSRSRRPSGVKHLDDDDEGTAWDGPLVVLIDKLSASASEIFAGVIKDYGRGLIIGDSSTFGKGTVQSIVPISEHTRRRDHTNRGCAEAHDPAVLSRQRREHADQRRLARTSTSPRSATTWTSARARWTTP